METRTDDNLLGLNLTGSGEDLDGLSVAAEPNYFGIELYFASPPFDVLGQAPGKASEIDYCGLGRMESGNAMHVGLYVRHRCPLEPPQPGHSVS